MNSVGAGNCCLAERQTSLCSCVQQGQQLLSPLAALEQAALCCRLVQPYLPFGKKDGLVHQTAPIRAGAGSKQSSISGCPPVLLASLCLQQNPGTACCKSWWSAMTRGECSSSLSAALRDEYFGFAAYPPDLIGFLLPPLNH